VAARLSDERVRAARESAAGDPLAEAKARLATGDAAAAEALARRVLAGAQGDARLEPLLTLGIAQYMARRPEEALTNFAEAQRLAPRDGRAYNFEARIRLTTGDPDGARRALERGLAQVPGDSALTVARRALEGNLQRP
jgi:Flp pilus assembly protein TadD